MVSDAPTSRGPLEGLRVVEIAGSIPAAFCARQLRGFGADTLRIEGLSTTAAAGCPDSLTDDQRIFLVAGARRFTLTGSSASDHLASVLAEADVIIEDQGPGFWAQHGFDPRAAAGQPGGPVVVSASPLGHDGPRSHWQATNAVQFALGGLMTLTGDPDRPPLVTGGEQALFLGGLHTWAATLVALMGRARTGRGTWIDLSLQEVAASMPELYAAQSEYDLNEPVPRSGNSVRAVWGVYPCADGYAGVCCLERQVHTFLGLLGPDIAGDARFGEPISRAEHDDELLAHVMSFMSEATKDELLALSPVHRVPFGAVRTPTELLTDETYAQRGFFDHIATTHGEATVPGRPFPGLGWVGAERFEPARPEPPTWLSAGATDDFNAATTGPRDQAWLKAGSLSPVSTGDSEQVPPPLSGLRVVDLTMMWAGPYATKLLAEAGAEVIKIESPRAWDNIRTLIPQDPSITEPWDSSYYFNEYNHSKKSLTLDLAQEAGREALLRLVATADVVIENYRADVLENLGLGHEVLTQAKDDIILVSMAGFGKTGPLSDHVGFGPIIEMMSGLMSLTGYGDDKTPYKTGISYGDPVGGLNAVAATVLALVQRELTGQGVHVDLAQRETASTMAGPSFVAASLRAEAPVHEGNRDARFVPQGCYPAAGDDRWVVVSVRTDDEWASLAHHLGRPDLAALDHQQRSARHDELDQIISAWTARLPAGDIATRLQGDSTSSTVVVPAAEVIDTLDVHDDPQLTARGFYRVVPNPKMRPYRQSGPTWRLHGPSPSPMRHSPWFGEHNDELLSELGFSPADIEALVLLDVVADAPINPKAG